MKDPVETLELCAYDAWPAEEVESLAGWRLRAMRGVTRRANSVWTFEATGDMSMDRRIDQAEVWYASRGLAATFQVTDRARPEGLDAALAQRRYAIDAPVSIQVAATADVRAVLAPGDASVTRTCSAEWFEISAHRGRFAKVPEIYRGLLERIGPAARFALARVDGQPAAVVLGVVARERMGIFSMLTLPCGRRRGAGRAVLAALAATAHEEGVEALYLQVERDNAPAIALYAAASFRELYGYHYRVAPDVPGER
jgi:N-acetylglutamate synthase